MKYFKRRIHRVSESGAVRHIASVSGDIGPAEVTDANAQLILAAPDLLTACEAFVQWADAAPDDATASLDFFEQSVEAARAAIAKALGEHNAEEDDASKAG